MEVLLLSDSTGGVHKPMDQVLGSARKAAYVTKNRALKTWGKVCSEDFNREISANKLRLEKVKKKKTMRCVCRGPIILAQLA